MTEGPSEPGRGPEEPGGGAPRRCPECRVVVRPGDKRCEFCGTKVAGADEGGAPLPKARKPAPALPRAIARVVAAACVVVAVTAVVRNKTAERDQPAPPLPAAEEIKQLAYRACEEYLRRRPPAASTVSSIVSALVAEERGGFVVSGTAELQDPTGASVRRRFSCRVSPDPRAGLIVDEGWFL